MPRIQLVDQLERRLENDGTALASTTDARFDCDSSSASSVRFSADC